MLRRGGYRTVAASDDAMAFVRTPVEGVEGVEGPAIVVAINAGDAAIALDLGLPEHTGGRLALDPAAGQRRGDGGKRRNRRRPGGRGRASTHRAGLSRRRRLEMAQAPRARSRRPILIGGALLVVLIVVAGVLSRGWLPGPVASPGPSGGVAVADKAPLATDGKVEADDIAHDSRADMYRAPFGAVPAGTEVMIRLRAAAGDLSRRQRSACGTRSTSSRRCCRWTLVATDPTRGDHGYDYWQITLHTSAKPTILYYRFIVRDGTETAYLEDDPANDGGAVPEASDGGAGRVYGASIDASWQIDVYDPAFTTPDWAKGAVAYQVFPDRFFDGDPGERPVAGRRAGRGWRRCLPLRRRVRERRPPEGLGRTPRRAPAGPTRASPAAKEPLGRDFYGGDLAGVTAKLDDLAALGVTVLYLNPIFAAPSNHRYDTSSYAFIDPDLGTQEEFDALVRGAEQRGMRVLLDGVFNHVASDSPWFDRARRYRRDRGLRGGRLARTAAWFTFRPPAANEPSPCAAIDARRRRHVLRRLVRVRHDPRGHRAGERLRVLHRRRWRRAALDRGGHRPAGGSTSWTTSSHGSCASSASRSKAADPEAFVLGEKWDDASI